VDLTSRSHLGLQQLRQDRDGGLEGGSGLFGQFGDACAMPCILRLLSMMTMAPLAGHDAWRTSLVWRSAS
jgi:hypothetical protein